MWESLHPCSGRLKEIHKIGRLEFGDVDAGSNSRRENRRRALVGVDAQARPTVVTVVAGTGIDTHSVGTLNYLEATTIRLREVAERGCIPQNGWSILEGCVAK